MPESSNPRIATIHGTNEQIRKALVALGKRIGQQRVPNPRREHPTRTGWTAPQPRVANPSPAVSASDEIPSDHEYLPERIDVRTAELEATIAKPPTATATVAETRAYCEELEAQTRIVEAEVRLLKLAGAPTSPRVRPKLQGVADREEVLATCTHLCDQVFGPKQ
jgi:hypothetical protein